MFEDAVGSGNGEVVFSLPLGVLARIVLMEAFVRGSDSSSGGCGCGCSVDAVRSASWVSVFHQLPVHSNNTDILGLGYKNATVSYLHA